MKDISMKQYNTIITNLSAIYAKQLTPARLVANRKDCYAIVINSINSAGVTLEEAVGNEYAKGITTRVLSKLLTGKPDCSEAF